MIPTPVITTKFSASGLDINPGEHYLLAETSDEFLEHVKNVFFKTPTDLIEKAYDFAVREHNWEKIRNTLSKNIKSFVNKQLTANYS